jgi:hypothetical protein
MSLAFPIRSTTTRNFEQVGNQNILNSIWRGADKSLAFSICSTTKRIYSCRVKEVRKTKS